MRRQTALPRISREGWVPAGPEKRVNKRAMLIPKTGNPSDHLPTLMDFSEVICPAERRALREIVETAEIVREGDHLYLLARVSAATLDSLATFETSREDMEEDDEPSIGSGSGGYEVDAELDTSDDEPDDEDGTNESALDWGEAEPGCLEARRRYIAGRQERHRASYDWTKDGEELRKVKRQVDALAAKKRKDALIEDRKGARS